MNFVYCYKSTFAHLRHKAGHLFKNIIHTDNEHNHYVPMSRFSSNQQNNNSQNQENNSNLTPKQRDKKE